MAQGPGSTRQNNGPFAVGGFYNFAPFTLVDGQACALQFDINGNLKVTSTGGGGGGSNPAAGPTGAPVPADADYLGINIGGTLFGVTGFNLPDSIPIAVAIVNANGDQITSFGGGTQYVDGTAESIGAFTGTVAFGYNGTDVVGLRMDASDNLLVNLNTPIPAGTNLIGQIEVSDGTNVLFTNTHPGYVQFASAQAVTLASTTITGTVAVTQSTNPWVDNLTEVAGVTLGSTAVVNFGTAPAAAIVPGVNSSIFAGTTGLTATGTSLNVNITGGSTSGTQYTDLTAETAGAFIGTVAMGYNGTDVVGLRLNTSNNLLVAGSLTTNNAAPAGNNIGVLSAIANAATPTYIEGNQVLLSTDLSGTLRVNGPYQSGVNLGPSAFYGILAMGLNNGTIPRAIEVGATGAVTVIGDGFTGQTVFNTGSSVGATGILFSFVNFNEYATGLVVGIDTTEAAEAGGSFIIEASDQNSGVWTPVTAIVVGTQQVVAWPYTPVTGTYVQFAINAVAEYQIRVRLATLITAGKIIFDALYVTQGEPLMPVIVAGSVPVTQSTSPWVDNLTEVAGVTLGATAVVAYGSIPAAVSVPAVNAFITNSVTVVGSKLNNNAAPGATNLGVLPGIANAATQTWTEGDQVLESMDLSGRQRIRGTLTHNNVAPSSDLIGVMNGLANASAPTYTEGDLVLQSVDLSGNTRIVGTKTNNSAAPTTQVGVIPAVANAATQTWTEGDQVLLSEDLSGNTRVIQPKDRGRSVLGLTYTNTANATTTTPTVLTTLVENSNYVSSTGVTAFQVPAGKTLRIQSLAAAALLNSTTAVTAIADAQSVYIEIRVSTTNTTTALSTAPIAAMLAFSLDYDVVGSAAYGERSFPDGVEVPAGDYVGITVHNAITTLATIVSGISLIGYTY